MKKLLTLLIALMIATTLKAQTATPLAQYAGNQLIYNPGFAGVYDLFSVNLSMKRLWMGIPNSPSLISFNMHMPFQSLRNAIGFTYQRETVGPQFIHTVNVTYAHKVFLGPTTFLSFGVQAGLLQSVTDWNMVDFVQDPHDPFYGDGRQRTNNADVNLGIYLQSQDFYLGLSVRHLTAPRFDEVTVAIVGETFYSQIRRQFFFMGGYNFRLSDDLDLRPHTMIRYKANAPLSVSVGANFVWDNRFFLGSNFMTGQRSVSLAVAAEILFGLRVGYSFDMNFGVLRPFQRGSHEISLNYAIPFWDRTRYHSTHRTSVWR